VVDPAKQTWTGRVTCRKEAESGAMVEKVPMPLFERPIARSIAKGAKTSFIERIHARPACQRAQERGGKYELPS